MDEGENEEDDAQVEGGAVTAEAEENGEKEGRRGRGNSKGGTVERWGVGCGERGRRKKRSMSCNNRSKSWSKARENMLYICRKSCLSRQ